MSARDDGPLHPNLDGLTFRAVTDRTGVIAIPTSAQTPPPYTYMPLPVAVAFASELSDLVDHLRTHDRASYAATYFDGALDDLVAAIDSCRPKPEPEGADAQG